MKKSTHAKARLHPCHQTIIDLFHCNPETGEVIWKVNRKGGAFAGDVAGGLVGNYWRICINGRFSQRSAIIWFAANGYWPPDEIDHINRNSADDRICNLRLATSNQNSYNKGPYKNNSSGVKGAYKVGNRWRVQITIAGKRKFLGDFDAIEDAAHAYREAANIHHGQFACAS